MIQFPSSEKVNADDALSMLKKQLQFNETSDEFRSQYVERPGEGLQVQRFQQYFKGLKVEHGSFSISSKNGIASFAFGRFFPTTSVNSITPTLDEATALNKAKAAVPADKYAWENGSGKLPEGRVCLVEDFANGDGDGQLHLAYTFDIIAVAPLAEYSVYVDAHDGHILFTNSILQHIGASGPSLYSGNVAFLAGLVSGTYYMYDSTRGGGIVTYDMHNQSNASNATIVTSSTTVFAQDPAVDAHWGAKIVYDYWKNVHNRNSWNGAGGILKSYVHYSTSYDNANWSGNSNAMFYGDGTGVAAGGFPPLTALDVCGHEIGHGVCQSTAGLVYSRESGAMNEGFSDIWGAVIETYGDPHESDTVAKDPWLIGEELFNVLRSMKDPKQYYQPDTYLGINWINASSSCTPNGANDQCGVHFNSGVLNYWFYLLSVGGKGRNDVGNNYIVDSIGMAKAARIAYATELVLNGTANYSSCRTASIAQATTIYGACSPEVQAVTQAWYAVGVGPDPVPCKPQVTFGEVLYPVTENAGLAVCKPTHIVSVPLKLDGATLTGDSAVVSVVVAGGTAVRGTDYEFLNPVFSFMPGGAVTKTIDILVYDNGMPGVDKYMDITYTLNAGTTNATRSLIKDTSRVILFNDDYIPYQGASNQRTVLTNSAAITNATPFYGNFTGAHAMYLYTAAELFAAGVRPNVPITAAAFNVMNKNSTQPYYNFNVNIGLTSLKNFANGLPTNTTNVYSDSLTTSLGWTKIPFSNAFEWNGTDNLVVEICFANNSNYGYDQVQGTKSSFLMTALNSSNINKGCSIALSTNYLIPARPVIQFTQKAVVESTKNSDRTWNVDKNQAAWYYSSSDQELIAGILNSSDSLGCVNVRVTQDGVGFRPASGGSERSLKEFSIQPGVETGTRTYDAVFYVSKAELAGVDPSLIYIVQTTSVDDNDLTPLNTNVVTPLIVTTGDDFIGFQGNFTAFGRFFLSNGTPALGVNPHKTADAALWTGQNPFTTAPVLHWSLSASEQVSIRLYDVAGRMVYSTEEKLASGTHALVLQSPANLAPGAYVLQVIRPKGVFTRQMMKQ